MDTAGFESAEAVNVPRHRQADAAEYSTTSSAKFGCLMEDLPINHREYTFVDIGCGKGRALMMASEFPFQSILGVEISSSLVEAAEGNIASFRSRRQQCRLVQVICQDATQFPFPDSPLIVYLYNPFSATILDEVLQTLVRSIDDNPRDVLIVYYNPIHEQVIAASSHFRQVTLRGWSDPRWRIYTTADSPLLPNEPPESPDIDHRNRIPARTS